MDVQTLQASIDAISSDVNTMKWIMGFIGALIVFVLGVLYRLNERVANLEGRFDIFITTFIKPEHTAVVRDKNKR